MKDIGIIADDLTGASDSGVQLARKGYNSSVVFGIDDLTEEVSSLDVIVVDTDSRAVPAAEAYDRVQRAVEKLGALGFTRFYKKIDSTLRGNLGIEIDALMDTQMYDFSIVAPAFPRIGRTTEGARHYLHGKRIDQTEAANDPKCPVLESDLITLLSNQSRRKVGAVHLSTLDRGKHAVLEQMESLKKQGIEIIVFDATEDSHLQAIVNHLSASPYSLLWVGSAGLAEHIPLLLNGSPSVERSFTIPGATDKSVMLVAGSLSQVTRKQIQAYNALPSVAAVEFDPALVMREPSRTEQWNRCLQCIRQAIDNRQDISFYVGVSTEPLNDSDEHGAPVGSAEAAERIAAFLGEVSAEVIQASDLQGLIMTGGDTAKAVCENLGVPGLVLLDEIESGIPISRLMGDRKLYVVTKAGAFGKELTLTHALHVLKGDQR